MLDPQIKKGLLEVCVLSVVRRGPSHGYQIIKDLAPVIAISESTLYPILRRLEGAGCLTAHTVEHQGRLRKIYQITPAGIEQIGSFLDGWADIMHIYDFIRKGEPEK